MAATRINHGMSMLLPVMAVILAIRLISLWFNNSELFFDEAQYWFWAQDLDFGYFSKPPLLAWIIAGTTGICGSDSGFCVRLAAPLMHGATAVFIYLSAYRLFDARTAFWAALLYATIPAVSLSSTIISTDVPLLLMWSIALHAYVRLWQDHDWKSALILGLAIGLGLNAKYAMAYFLGCALIHAMIEQQNLTPPRRSLFWVALLIAVAMLVPNILWNLNNGFVTLAHTGDNIGWTGIRFNWRGIGEFFGSQFGVFGPILFAMFLATIIRMLGDSISREHRMLLAFSFPVFFLILFQALMSKAYANWAATTYIAASILVAEILVNRVSWNWMRATIAIHLSVFLALAVAVCFAGPGQLVLPNGVEPFARTQGAALIAVETEKLLDAQEYNALITTDRKLSALLQYNLRHREETILAWRFGKVARDHFQLAVPFQASPRDPALVVSRQGGIKAFSQAFDTVIPLGSRDISAGEIEKVHFFKLEGHQSFK